MIRPVVRDMRAGTRSGVSIIIEWVRALVLSSAPSFNAVGDDPHLKTLQDRLRFLFKHTEEGDEGEVAYFAEDAMNRRCAELATAMEAGTLSDLGDLKALDSFSWMLTAEQKRHKRCGSRSSSRRRAWRRGQSWREPRPLAIAPRAVRALRPRRPGRRRARPPWICSKSAAPLDLSPARLL